MTRPADLVDALTATVRRIGGGWQCTTAESSPHRVTLVVDRTGAFTCPACGATSHHPDDLAHGYCAHCHAFTAPDPTCR